ncbi:DUF4435 domain-containing protein [Luteolibacter pohnpeiensis]|uniref:DUF4435 domain-containing protein n=1 Tax=Luteolibacter pohnpeiensis TaxID=454153 RepID=A0A934SB26_9BACT|nr:DUF4435 domain-containing protein [Luteolibacter pohnpeiensis]MBK1884609.1 DUF4435 domain-containing protein [Luteolibacter pohnpeiensis]
MIPKRKGYRGKSYLLFSDYNDVHIFVEDDGFENLYRELFRRTGLNINKIFSKGGKRPIIDSATNCTDPNCFYIVDMDWDDLLDKKHDIERLIFLKKHSIENYLIDYSGFRAIIIADNPRKNIENIFNENDFKSIVETTSNRLRPLFECFAAILASQNGLANCKIPPKNFQKKNNYHPPDPDIINNFISDAGLTINPNIKKYFTSRNLTNRGHGKYMLHFIWIEIRHKTKCAQISDDCLKIRLAQSIKEDDFKKIATKIIKIHKAAKKDRSNISIVS